MHKLYTSSRLTKSLLLVSAALMMSSQAFAQTVDAALNVDNQFMVVVTDITGVKSTPYSTQGSTYSWGQTARFSFDIPLDQMQGQCLVNIITWGDGAKAEGLAGVMKGNAGYVYSGGVGPNGIWNAVETSIPHGGSGPNASQVPSILDLNGPPPTNLSSVTTGNMTWGPITDYSAADFGTSSVPSDFRWVRPINGGQTTQNYWVFKTPCGRLVEKIVTPPAPTKKGMTFGIRDPEPNPVNGVVHVGCGDNQGVNCDAINGDTVCSVPKPILCIKPLKLPKPSSVTESGWDKWSGGIVGTTKPMAAPDKLSDANKACQDEFQDSDWRVAQFHDVRSGRSGWSFSAYGNVGTQDDRFWADIDDQANGVCWDRTQ